MALDYNKTITLSDGVTTIQAAGSASDWGKLIVTVGNQSLGFAANSQDMLQIQRLMQDIQQGKIIDLRLNPVPVKA